MLPHGVLDALLGRPPALRAAIGPLSLDIHASDERTARLATQALAHARSDAVRPRHIRIAFIDAARAGLPAPAQIAGTEHLLAPHDEVNLRTSGRVVAIHQAQSRTWEGYDAQRRIGVVFTADAEGIAPWEWASPAKRMIEWATVGQPYGLLHGAVLALDGEGVLLAGNSGVGKSTTTAAAMLRGLQTAGDDVALIEWRDDGAVLAHAAYDSLKVGAGSLTLLDGAIGASGEAVGPGIAKYMLRISDVAPRALTRTVRLRAILLPRISGSVRTTLRPAEHGEALRALGPVSSFVMRVAPESTFARASRLVRSLPCHRLDLSGDPAEVAGAIAGLLARPERLA